jgi:hypothetical protein
VVLGVRATCASLRGEWSREKNHLPIWDKRSIGTPHRFEIEPHEVDAFVCRLERSEGSHGQILHCARNDKAERLRRKVYGCLVV